MVEKSDGWVWDLMSDAVLGSSPFPALTMIDRRYSSAGLACASVALRRGRRYQISVIATHLGSISEAD